MEAVKFVKGSDSLIEGLAIPFGGPIAGKDLDGEDFGADTDFAFDWFPQGRPVIYHHGVDGALKHAVQGRQHEHEIIDEGIWARAQLDTSAKYHGAVAKLIAAGKLFFSSGSMSHLIDADEAGHIKRWPWIELSLTPTPANPLAVVHAVKATDVIDHLAAAEIAVPPALIAAALKALDAPPDFGVSGSEAFDRLSADGSNWVRTSRDWYAKSGRVLSAATRERLMRHPTSLRELADELDSFLTESDGEKVAKSVDLSTLALETEGTIARLLGVPFTAGGQVQ